MYDKELTIEVLSQILTAIDKIQRRFLGVSSSDYFNETDDGNDKFDAICMQLIFLGESLKKIDKLTDKKLLDKYPSIDWRGAKGLRDVITHNYTDVDPEAVFEVCQSKIEPLKTTVEEILSDIRA